MSSWELRARELYALAPAVTSFSGQPIPYERAGSTRSFAKAQVQALQEQEK